MTTNKKTSLLELQKWIGSLTAGLIFILDKTGKLTYENVDSWKLDVPEHIELKIFNPSYPQNVVDQMLLNLLEFMNGENIRVIFYGYDNIENPKILQYTDVIKIFKGK